MGVHPAFKLGGLILVTLGVAQSIPLAVALVSGEPEWRIFGISALSAALAGSALLLLTWRARAIKERDGFAAMTLSMLTATCAGALPYLLTPGLGGFTDAIFESMSGFTTTGASTVAHIDGMSESLLLWRSMTQWLGGLGILVFAVVVLPSLGIGGMQIYKREVPGVYSENFGTRIKRTAFALWIVYAALTVVEFCVLYLLGLPPLEAANHSLTTISTGGFSTQTGSVGGYASPAIEWAVIIFMLLAGMNFSLHYRQRTLTA